MDKAARKVFDLIQRATSQEVVRAFLKSKNVASSGGSWEFLRESRVEPAYDAGAITYDDLLNLLRNVEEHGRQHIFLFSVDPKRATALGDQRRIARVAGQQELSTILDAPIALNMPDTPTIVDIRHERFRIRNEVVEATVIKQIETRETAEYLGRKPTSTGFIKEYSVERSRAVNIVRLYNSGLLELRVAARDNTTRYHDDVKALFASIRPFFPADEFAPISLRRAKDRFVHRSRAATDGLSLPCAFSELIARRSQHFPGSKPQIINISLGFNPNDEQTSHPPFDCILNILYTIEVLRGFPLLQHIADSREVENPQ